MRAGASQPLRSAKPLPIMTSLPLPRSKSAAATTPSTRAGIASMPACSVRVSAAPATGARRLTVSIDPQSRGVKEFTPENEYDLRSDQPTRDIAQVEDGNGQVSQVDGCGSHRDV